MVCALCCAAWIVVLTIGYFIYRWFRELTQIDQLNDKAVLITGCDSGFGRALALKCAQSGLTVFAGCLTDEGVSSLKVDANTTAVHVIKLDITKDESVAAARKYVNDNIGSKKFWSIVNNAGIFSCYGPVDWCSPSEYQLALEVNTIGGIRVTNAFLDLLKSSRGRIVTVSSTIGLVAFPGAAPYAVSKYGVEAWMDCMRRELRPFGVTAHLLEPGGFKSTMLLDEAAMEKRMDSVWAKMTEDERAEYGEDYKKEYRRFWTELTGKHSSTRIHYVVDNYFHAITALHPRARYLCGWDANYLWAPMAYMPTVIQDRIIDFMSKLEDNKIPVPASVQRGGKYFKEHQE